MVAFHPPLSGFPLAFLVLLIAAELLQRSRWASHALEVRKAALAAMVTGCALAFFSGYQASADVGVLSEGAEQALSSHHAWGRLLLINSLLVALFSWVAHIARYNRRAFAAIYYALLAVQVGLTIWVGALGGALVFEHGVGVRPSE